jgi:hypothetical protein
MRCSALHIRTTVCYTTANPPVEAEHVSATTQRTYSSKIMPGRTAGKKLEAHVRWQLGVDVGYERSVTGIISHISEREIFGRSAMIAPKKAHLVESGQD